METNDGLSKESRELLSLCERANAIERDTVIIDRVKMFLSIYDVLPVQAITIVVLMVFATFYTILCGSTESSILARFLVAMVIYLLLMLLDKIGSKVIRFIRKRCLDVIENSNDDRSE